MSHRSIRFCFADPKGFSGQKAAVELVMSGLSERGWICRKLPQPVFDRNSGGLRAQIRYVIGLGAAWLRALCLLRAREGWLWVGLGQTRVAFIRDVVPLLLGRIGLGRQRIIVSLNGSLFMHWPDSSFEVKFFRFLLKQAGKVTVVGAGQRTRLVSLGVAKENVVVVVNSCELSAIKGSAFSSKIERTIEANEVVRFLHLSSLIDTKGFPEYLEALRLLSRAAGPRIEAVLCGRIVASEFSNRFCNVSSTETWIIDQLAKINSSTRVRVRWINGAMGVEKARLFREADVFVLPTCYAVEAQPLVLLEAMACGCAIITTRVGEIPAILDDDSACFLGSVSVEALAPLMERLSVDRAERGRLARSARARYLERYQLEHHLDLWENLLGPSQPLGRKKVFSEAQIGAPKDVCGFDPPP